MPVFTPDGEMVESHVGGLSQARPSAALLTGSAVHAGFEHLLICALPGPQEPGIFWPTGENAGTLRGNPKWHVIVEQAATAGLTLFDNEVATNGISFGLDPAAAEFYLAEQRGLVEGLIWTAGLRLVPELIGRYEVVAVEREERLELGTGCRPFAARADAVLRERRTGDLSVFSLKTAAMYGMREEMRFKRDVQGLSEAIAVERRLAQENTDGIARMMREHSDLEPLAVQNPKVETVQMAILLKGIRRAAESRGGRKEHGSPLVRAWKLEDPLSGLSQWAYAFETPKLDKQGNSYMGRLGKEWKQTPTWEYPGGVGAWVRALDRGEIQPELASDPLMAAMAFPEPWGRSETEMEDWLVQARTIAQGIEEGARVVNDFLSLGDTGGARQALNVFFPQDRRSCISFNQNCVFDSVCWGGQGLVQLAGGQIPDGLALRKDHHASEGDSDE